MNKNIKELAMEAGFPVTGFYKETTLLANESAINTFAQLLLKECAMIAELNGDMSTSYQIKHHFGDCK
jgi:hypothetical protein